MKKTITDYELEGKRIIIRCDFNVPMKDGIITDDTRIKESLKTIEYAIKKNAKVILLSHLGRVKEESDKEKSSLAPIAKRLSELLGKEVIFSEETRGKKLENLVSQMKNQDVLLIQNTRYEDIEGKKESTNDKELSTYWARLGDIFINDAFGTAHRAHASNVGIASILPSGIGFLIEKELKELQKLENPSHPFIVILGGAKVSDKIGVIESLAKKADKILIGGAMAFTFLKAKGYCLGQSLVEEEMIPFCKDQLEKYKEKLVLPIDLNVATEKKEDEKNKIVTVDKLEPSDIAMDLGTKTISLFQQELEKAKTCFWNGPLGVYEIKKYQTATNEILKTLANLDAISILGGGDIVACANTLGYKDKLTHASTGGGATLELLEGKPLPGIEVISERN